MLKNYFNATIRHLGRDKIYSLINILGLAAGIACSTLILLWVADELSYDRFHKNAYEIYRVVGDDVTVGKMTTTCGPLSEYLKNNFPDVVNSTRYMPYSGSAFKYNEKLFNIEKGAFADPSFLEIFSLNFLRGNPKTALLDISSIVITESMAKKFFGEEDPLGKTIYFDGKSPSIVSAVIKDMPANSQLQFNFIINTLILKYIGFPIDEWSNAGFQTFIQVGKKTDIKNLNMQIAGIMPKQIPGFGRRLFLQPLTDIHLNTDYAYDFPELGDKKYVYIFSAIAIFLVLIACINYINLSTAGILKRAREVGLRKVMGSSRFQIIKQFLSESTAVIIPAFILSTVLIEILLPEFNQVSGKALSINYFNISFSGWAAVLLILVLVVSGGYPALFLSSVKPVYAVKNILGDRQRGSLFRKILVVVQFSLSIILIVGTITVYNQLNFIKNKKLGFEKENILFIKAKGEFQQSYNTIKNELLAQSSIVNVTAEDRLLTNNTSSTNNLYWEGKDNKTDVHAEYSYVDYNYFDMLNIEMKEGRRFSNDMSMDRSAFILNEEAADQMKMKNPVGKSLTLNNIHGNIIGIIKNTNFKSLHHKVSPSVYLLLNDYSNLSFLYNGIILIKTAGGKTQDAVSVIENIWKKVNPDVPFEYHFLDETIDKQYVKENQTAKIFIYCSFIAIFISCLGLYGLSLFMIENRIREIGVRKVLGATVSGILKMFYNDFSKLILLSGIIACPVAWYVMDKWLQNFAYRIEISWWMFALAGGTALVIALATVSFQAVKAATANPVESLKYE